ncbi:hypothetical protein KR018_010760, partial [Drosophila ironensis]
CNIVAIVFCCFCIRWAVGCETLCSMNFRPVCGFDGDCYTDARNLCVMKNRNCRRMESNLPGKTTHLRETNVCPYYVFTSSFSKP